MLKKTLWNLFFSIALVGNSFSQNITDSIVIQCGFRRTIYKIQVQDISTGGLLNFSKKDGQTIARKVLDLNENSDSLYIRAILKCPFRKSIITKISISNRPFNVIYIWNERCKIKYRFQPKPIGII